MGCFAVPTAAAIIHKIMRKKVPSLKNDKNHRLLNYLFIGGSIFGIVDHAWNGELFLLGQNLLWDMALGLAITATIVFVWKLIVLFEAISEETPSRATSKTR